MNMHTHYIKVKNFFFKLQTQRNSPMWKRLWAQEGWIGDHDSVWERFREMNTSHRDVQSCCWLEGMDDLGLQLILLQALREGLCMGCKSPKFWEEWVITAVG